MKNYDRYSLALIATARLLCVDNFKMHNLDMNTKAAIHFENLSKFHKSNWVLCADGGMCKTQSTQGPSWPRNLGRSDFSLQEN